MTQKTQKNVVIGVVVAFLLIIVSATSNNDSNTPTADPIIKQAIQEEVVVDSGNKQKTTTIEEVSYEEETESYGQVPAIGHPSTQKIKEPTLPEEDPNNYSSYKVVEVVDGDTVKLIINGNTETIRLIGIDTPETVHPSKPVECFGIEASNKAKEILNNETVALEVDASQGERDKYDRLLGYIILSGGTNFNKLMIEQGYAYEYTYSTPYKYQSNFKLAEEYARENGIGLWADGVCDENTDTTQDDQTSTNSNGKWYVSSYYSSKYYYCDESDGWKSLSGKYLEVYDSEAELLEDFPNHTLHESCQ